MEEIYGYVPMKPFGTAGAGTASWTIAKKDGREYFLKRFNSPKYVPECLEFCQRYEAQKQKLYDAIRKLDNGNLIVIEDFFRFDTFYYIATQTVHETSITAENAYALPRDKVFILMKTLVHCMMQLERGGIVHADLKPSNVMLKPTTAGFYSLKLIDFDSSFFVSDPPEATELEGDMVYLSPEILMAMCGEKVPITSKIDVFATGIMFHQFLTGELPRFDDGEYDHICEAVASDAPIYISDSISKELRDLIQSMLLKNPEERPSFSEVFERLTGEVGDNLSGSMHSEERTVPNEEAVTKNRWLKQLGNL